MANRACGSCRIGYHHSAAAQLLIKCVKTHNPFIVNDIVFSREFGFNPQHMNNCGCSLIWGHPQGPTALRAIIELIEELRVKGGGYGLFVGCAAGGSAMALVLEVKDRKPSE